MQTPQPSPSPSPASLFRRTSANEKPDHMADHPTGALLSIFQQGAAEAPGEGGDSPARELVTTPGPIPSQPIQDEGNVWDEAGSFLIGVGASEGASNSSVNNKHSDINSSLDSLWLPHSDLNPYFGREFEANASSAGGTLAVDLLAGIPQDTIETLNQNGSTIPQVFISNDTVHHNDFYGPPNLPPSMGVPNFFPSAQFEYPNVQAVGLPDGHQLYPVQNQMNWNNNFGQNFLQHNSMQPCPVSPNSFANAGIPLGIPVHQRTPCTWAMCSESFARQGDLQRHVESVHLGIKYPCFWPGCPNNRGNGYCRLEKLRTHQKQKHGYALV